MSQKRFKPEEIVNKLREAEVLLAQSKTVTQACNHTDLCKEHTSRFLIRKH